MDQTRRPLRVLFVEDAPNDAELEAMALRRGGFEPSYRRVETREDMEQALSAESWDIVIADYNMPRFDGMSALSLFQEKALEIPFILVSGTIGEEVAVAAMKAGAQDYLLKSNLTRLAVAVARELRESEARRNRNRAVKAQKLFADTFSALAESLDWEANLPGVARLVVAAEVADSCVIDVLDEDCHLRRIASAPVDPADNGTGPPLSWGTAMVVRTGEPELVPELSDASLSLARDPEAQQAQRARGVRSLITVPLQTRGTIRGTLTLASTRTDRRYGSADLALAQELARRAALAIDTARLYQKSQEAVRLRDEFLAIASHELNTPLTVLQLELEGARSLLRTVALENASMAASARPVAEKLDRATSSTERLVALVKTLLDVSQISSEKMELNLERFDLVALVRHAVESFEEEAARSGATLIVAGDASAMGRWDRLRIQQVLGSMLSNALRYGGSNPIEIKVEVHDESARLQVTDSGIGIASADTERIFGRFERASSIRHYGGLGLGLYVAQKIVQAHGGTVGVVSNSGKGATFTVDLPLDHRPA